MNPLIGRAVEALRGAGWVVKLGAEPQELPASIAKRHPQLPPLLVEFITAVESCVREDEGCWLLTSRDYASTAGDAFRWDEFERMVLEDSGDEEARQARAFWDGYLPIYQLVSDDYQYMAIGTDQASDDFGKVLWGDVVDYDSPLVLAGSYADFLIQLSDAARRRPTRSAFRQNHMMRLVHAGIVNNGRDERGGGWWAAFKRWWEERPR